jgi:hypothetical protein
MMGKRNVLIGVMTMVGSLKHPIFLTVASFVGCVSGQSFGRLAQLATFGLGLHHLNKQ